MFQPLPFLRSVAVFAMASLALSGVASATVANGSFDDGTLSGWNTYLNSNGSLGVPAVVPFDTVAGIQSNAVRVIAGQITFDNPSDGGGGLSQSFFAQNDSLYVISADIASQNASRYLNGDGGTVRLILDGISVTGYSFEEIDAHQIARASLNYQGFLTAGAHELRIEVSRRYRSNPSTPTPYQFIDNVQVSSVPEPISGVLMAIGLSVIALQYARRGGMAA
ncbi:MAG: hypothetical protein C0487_04390 [Leptothrix sp. (in: Bacteria)]|nr:hypothetical protein [Leptothrix sp. (in: b-proteobacteria)]